MSTHGTPISSLHHHAVVASIEELRRQAAELLGRAEALAASTVAAVAALEAHDGRSDIPAEQFERWGVFGLLGALRATQAALEVR